MVVIHGSLLCELFQIRRRFSFVTIQRYVPRRHRVEHENQNIGFARILKFRGREESGSTPEADACQQGSRGFQKLASVHNGHSGASDNVAKDHIGRRNREQRHEDQEKHNHAVVKPDRQGPHSLELRCALQKECHQR